MRGGSGRLLELFNEIELVLFKEAEARGRLPPFIFFLLFII